MRALFERVARDAARYHGPYRSSCGFPAALHGGPAGHGHDPRPRRERAAAARTCELALDATGRAACPTSARTNANGVAAVEVHGDERRRRTPDGEDASRSPRPCRVYFRRRRPPAPATASGSPSPRLAGACSGTSARHGRARRACVVVVGRRAGRAARRRGAAGDRVTLKGAAPSFRGTVAARLYGPFRTRRPSIRCDGDAGVGGHVARARAGRLPDAGRASSTGRAGTSTRRSSRRRRPRRR